MSGVNVVPSGYKQWPLHHDNLQPDEVITMYNSGFAGALINEEGKEEFLQECMDRNGTIDGSDLAHANGWADSGAGKLVIPFTFAEKVFPGCWPGPAQQRGDCVSHGTKNAILTTMFCEIVTAKPDEVTGLVEGAPEMPAEGIQQGVVSSEYIYWWRGYNGDGWSCPTAANSVLKHGILLKKPYTDLNIDLTHYSGSLAGKYGSKSPPSEINAEGNKHLIRTCTPIRSFEEVRDFLNNGYGISTCGGQGWSNSRDENGFSRQQGSWSHALCCIGADDRDEVKSKYGGPLVLILNSWAKWNSGPRRILGTQTDIPEGSFWAKYSDCRGRDWTAFSSLNGWPAKNLPDFIVI